MSTPHDPAAPSPPEPAPTHDAALRWLEGDQAEGPLDAMMGLLASARLNHQFSPSRALIAGLEALHPRPHRNLYPGVEVDAEVGLPTFKSWTRARNDLMLAPELLAQLGERKRLEDLARNSPRSIHGKQLLKHFFYSELAEAPCPPLSEMTIALRRLDPEQRTASVQIILDKFDARGLFVRFTIELSQTDSIWSRPLVRLNEDLANYTEPLRASVYRLASFDAEMVFINLASNPGIVVERVVKGTVGPLLIGELAPDNALTQLLHDDTGRLGMFALDMAACDIAADSANDPVEPLLSERLSDRAQEDYHAARKTYGYRVFKDRKFVCDRRTTGHVKALCRQAGTRNVIYTMRPRRKR